MLTANAVFELNAGLAHGASAEGVLAYAGTARAGESVAQAALHEDLIVLDASWAGSAEEEDVTASFVFELLEALVSSHCLNFGATHLQPEVAAGLATE